MGMTRSDLISALAIRQNHLVLDDVALGAKCILELLSDTLAAGERVEIRGFGSFALRYRQPRFGRNPRTGERVSLPGRYAVHFKAGDRLRTGVSLESPSPDSDLNPVG